ncbi:MAG: peptide ABC transporter substrate-binding protein [Chloroflexi bacterium]|nr:peptide ABC transporter substrate-binding protein [Chloroflexota bacterium]
MIRTAAINLRALPAAIVVVIAVACGGSALAVDEGAAAAPDAPTAQPAATAFVPALPTSTSVVPDGVTTPDAGDATEVADSGTAEVIGAASASDERVAYIALTAEIGSLDPSAVSEGSLSEGLVRALFAGLFRLNADGIAADLVDSWSVSPDGLLQTFILNSDVRWSDGTALTAHDAVFGILRSLDPANASPDQTLLASVIRGGAEYLVDEADASFVGVRATDDTTLVVETNIPASFLPSLLARPSAFPQPRHLAEGDPDWFDSADIVSSGPFRVINRVPGGNLVLARNPDYNGSGIARLDGIVFVSAPTDAAAAMVENGVANAIVGLTTPLSKSEISPSPSLAAEVVSGRSAYSLRFDVSQPPFDNVLVRRAFGVAIDRAALISETADGPSRSASTLTPPGVPGGAPSGSGIGLDFDVQRARDLLAEAGYPDFHALEGFTLSFAGGGNGPAVADAISQFWRQAFGLIVPVAEVERVDGAWSQQAGPTVWIERHESPYLDADGWLRILYRSDSVLNVGGYAEDSFDAAVDQGAIFTELPDRARAYRQAETILVQIDVAAVPLFVEDVYRWSQAGLAESLAPDGSVLLESWDIR